MKRFAAILAMFFLSACGGGSGNGGGNASSGTSTNSTGSSVFSVTYTNTTDTNGVSIVPAIDLSTEWFVENADGSVRGPYTSAGTGTVQLGQEGRATANLTMGEGTVYYATYMEAPVQPLTAYSGDQVGTTSVRVTLQNTGATGEMLLNVPYRGVMQVTADPAQFYSSTVLSGDILGTDNLASIFIGYRTSSLQEPASLYDFRMGIPWNSVGSQSFDVSSMKSYATRTWSCVDDLSNNIPYVVAQRKGLLFNQIGRGATTNVAGTTGVVGVPDLFPADSWYLASGSIVPKIVKQFSLSSSSIQLVPLDRYIDSNSFSYDATQRTFSFSLPAVSGKAGTDQISFGRLHLSVAGSMIWDVYFPWSSVVNGKLTLPALPGHQALPAFDFAQLDVYRLDSGSYRDMLLFSMNHMGYPLPGYAMDSAFKFLP